MTSGQQNKLNIHAFTSTSAAGTGNNALLTSLKQGTSGLRQEVFMDADSLSTWIGRVDGLEHVVLPDSLARFKCRNNQLAYLALNQDGFLEKSKSLISRYSPARVGVFMGTSTSGILETELAYRELEQNEDHLPEWYNYDETHNNYSIAKFVSRCTGASGPSLTISTACSSSAKVFAAADRYISAGFCDAAIVGGVDSLCLTTLYGFHSLQLLSENMCRPGDIGRDGINIGEAAAFSLVSKDGQSPLQVLGYGENSDAHHMSAPHPEGLGAKLSMEAALQSAELQADQIDYINLHGTGTKANDASECTAVNDLFGHSLPCSSTKFWSGHTLGAAGALEAAIACLSIQHNFMPGALSCKEKDSSLPCNILTESQSDKDVSKVLSNSFGFGGSNCALIIGEHRL